MVTDMKTKVALTSEQKEAISEIHWHLQIVACAGSGKTEVITRRIANILKSNIEIAPENIVAFTFTEKAAESMKSRIAKALDGQTIAGIDQMYVGTIHSFCYHLLNKYTDQFRDFKILDTVKNHLFVARYSSECGMSDLELECNPFNVKLFLQCIEKMIDDFNHADTWEQKDRNALDHYINCLYDHRYIDFSLMIFETLRQIETNPAVKEYLSQIKHLVVDEYQDINDLQEKLIHCIADAGAIVCVVGDDDQTIYQFRGSNANNMISFSERYPDVHQVRLETNFRCDPGIIDIADCVIRNNQRRIAKRMVSNKEHSIAIIEASRFPGETEQFDAIAQRIIELHESGVPYKEIAILVRKGKYTFPASLSLGRKGIPFEADSAEQFFSGDYFHRFVDTLQILTDIEKGKLYECWQDLVDTAAFNNGFKYLRSCIRGGKVRLGDILQKFCEKIAFLEESADDIEIRRSDLEGMVRILDDYDEIYGDWQLSARIESILRFLEKQAEQEYKYHNFKQKDPDVDAVRIMTVHKAKGLEFHTVFLPKLTKNEFPILKQSGKRYYHVLKGVFEENKDKYQSDLEDESKLFYVAVTRAKQNLLMTYELLTQSVSCFVKEAAESQYLKIERDDLEFVPTPKPKKRKASSVTNTDDKEYSSEKDSDFEEERQQRREYWARVKYARHQLLDYYGTASHFFPGAHGDLIRVQDMSPEEVLSEASKNGLI